jgi:hypothetical protein
LPALPLAWPALPPVGRVQRLVWLESQPVGPVPAAVRTTTPTPPRLKKIVSQKTFACRYRLAHQLTVG